MEYKKKRYPVRANKGTKTTCQLKAFLESYEAFIDEYCDFMEHYNSSDISQLAFRQILEK